MAEDKTNTQTVEELEMAFETENAQSDTMLETNFNQFERVRDHELEELARMKRERTVGKGLITVVSEKLFPTKNGKSERIQVLTMQIGTHTTAYCPITEAGINVPKNPQWLVGRTKPLIIEHFQKTEEGNFAVVSITAGEIALQKRLYEEVETQEGNKVYTGTVSGHIPSAQTVLVEVHGVTVGVRYSQWSHSFVRSEDIVIGDIVELIIDKVVEKNGRYEFRGNKKILETDPMEKLLELNKRRDRFIGKIVGVDAIAGIFVEVAPGIQFKGLKSRNLANPTAEDALNQTIVTCELLNIDAKNRRGTVRILNYPQGQSKKSNSSIYQF
ncbi:RNA-binding protein [Bacillus thuringiensis serovar brasilensis]|uniref:RNA-binding protein n=1 Tax=Bacillus cereus group TaxID=86661 RepID=UPI000A3B5DF3|nr:RNA-binding protein [Bacillus thuringiensis]MCU5032259.1 RNA-binding protein [Bacillus cereus]MRA75441.1 RNA-binding protein [Bacillus thuringiensis]MRA93918.1 RNA-binding protein [Bacillus thuringiensis]MRC56650.1 RNA-binding protein [Bacillus thuringiensis]OTX35421.1 RNA-binding protein [Bacillus thuringiensis serovar brasilensis]